MADENKKDLPIGLVRKVEKAEHNGVKGATITTVQFASMEYIKKMVADWKKELDEKRNAVINKKIDKEKNEIISKLKKDSKKILNKNISKINEGSKQQEIALSQDIKSLAFGIDLWKPVLEEKKHNE